MRAQTESFESIRIRGEAVRDFLNQQRVVLHPSSALALALDGAAEAVSYWRAKLVPSEREEQRLMRDLATIDALAPVVETIRKSGPVAGLTQRLTALAAGDPHIISRGAQSAARDALFELMCWHICGKFASDVVFAEPDVCCVYRGRHFGLACKAHYGHTGRAVKAIRKGWRQIRTSQVEYGFVMLHLTNHFPHARMYGRNPADGEVLAPSDEAVLTALFDQNLQRASSLIEGAFLAHLRANPRPVDGRFQGIVYSAHTLPYFRGTRYRMGGCVYQRMHLTPPEDAWAFVQNLNAFWQDLSASYTRPLP